MSSMRSASSSTSMRNLHGDAHRRACAHTHFKSACVEVRAARGWSRFGTGMAAVPRAGLRGTMPMASSSQAMHARARLWRGGARHAPRQRDRLGQVDVLLLTQLTRACHVTQPSLRGARAGGCAPWQRARQSRRRRRGAVAEGGAAAHRRGHQQMCGGEGAVLIALRLRAIGRVFRAGFRPLSSWRGRQAALKVVWAQRLSGPGFDIWR